MGHFWATDPFLRSLPSSELECIATQVRRWGLHEESFLEKVDRWFSNFNREDKELALKIFYQIDFFGYERFNQRLRALGDILVRQTILLGLDTSELLVVTPAGSSDSAHRHAYDVRQAWGLATSDTCSIRELNVQKASYKVLVTFNDTHGSGKQFMREVWPSLKAAAETAKATFIVATTVAEEALQTFTESLPNVQVIPDTPTPNARQLFSKEDFDRVAELGSHVYAKHPLGFGGTALTVAYYFQCPNNSLPLIWADGHNNEVSGKTVPWSPLFPYIPKVKASDRAATSVNNDPRIGVMTNNLHQTLTGNMLWAPSVEHLVGVEQQITALTRVVLDQDHPPIISIEGLGGLGKTVIAQAVATRCAELNSNIKVAWYSFRKDDYSDLADQQATGPLTATMDDVISNVAWQLGFKSILISPDRNRLGGFIAALATEPNLVVLDNVETDAEILSILPLLKGALRANPTRFIITSRAAIFRHVSNAYIEPLNELSRPLAVELLRQQARLTNLTHVSEAPDEEFKRIFEVVGGNPLALKLAVGMLRHLDVDQVVDTLAHARGARADELYRFIYWSAWRMLTDLARTLLIAMRHVSQTGADLARISAISALAVEPLLNAIQELADLSLLTVFGPINARRYSIHRLTVSFTEEVLQHWDDEKGVDGLRKTDAKTTVANVRHTLDMLDGNSSDK